MKRLFISTICLVVSVAGALAQVKVDRGYGSLSLATMGQQATKRHDAALAIKYGVKVGVNLSNMSNGMTFDPAFSIGIGYHAGAVVNFHWGQRTASSLPGTGLLGLQPEVLFSSQRINSSGGHLTLNYIKVPVMLKVYPLARLSIELGPEFSYLIASSPEYLTAGGAIVNVGECQGFDCGAGAGISYEFKFGLLVGSRYSMGFTDLSKNLKWKNNSNIQITVGWLF